MELFRQFQDNPSFKKWLSDLVFNLTYNKEGKPFEPPQKLDESVEYEIEPLVEALKIAEDEKTQE